MRMSCNHSFNSKLVRLKVNPDSSSDTSLSSVISFNSKLVRLKASVSQDAASFALPFQFQTGSIKRKTAVHILLLLSRRFNSKLVRLKVAFSETIANQACFNSKLVRLKVRLFPLNKISKSGFNSKLVRLKVNTHRRRAWDVLGFNSKLVRLKVDSVTGSKGSSDMFQFQTGSI